MYKTSIKYKFSFAFFSYPNRLLPNGHAGPNILVAVKTQYSSCKSLTKAQYSCCRSLTKTQYSSCKCLTKTNYSSPKT